MWVDINTLHSKNNRLYLDRTTGDRKLFCPQCETELKFQDAYCFKCKRQWRGGWLLSTKGKNLGFISEAYKKVVVNLEGIKKGGPCLHHIRCIRCRSMMPLIGAEMDCRECGTHYSIQKYDEESVGYSLTRDNPPAACDIAGTRQP